MSDAQGAEYVPTLGSLFAGVGGFDLGFEAAGFRTLWQVEIDRWATEVLKRHWPAAAHHGDICKVSGDELAPVDVITFGSPCQDMSVAGNRAGLAGDKSALFHEACRVIDEMRKANGGRFPAWAVWENVPGALSSDSGNDFSVVLDSLAAIGAVELEWRVLDARFFGVPQRRRRIFLVAGFHPRAGSAGPVLLESASGNGRATPSRPQGEDIAGTLGAGSAGGGWADDTDRMTFIPVEGHPVGIPDVARCVTASQTRIDGETETFVPIGFAWQAGGRKDACGAFCDDDTSPTLPANQTMAVAYGVAENQRAECLLTEYAHDLTTGGGKPGQGYPAVMQGIAVRRLTPRECERLMGWPDDHTRWTSDGREISDAQRYRMCGNGVVASVAEWVARRLPLGAHIDGVIGAGAS